MSDEKPRTQQFGILDLFAWMTVASMLVALAAPLLRQMEPQQRFRAYVAVGLQIVIVLGVVYYANWKRRATISELGACYGTVYFGTLTWRHWPVFKSCFLMVFFAVAQLAVSLGFVLRRPDSPATLGPALQYIQLAFFSGYAFARFSWRVYPGAAEIFDGGVVRTGFQHVPWERIQVRDSSMLPGRFVFVLQPQPNQVGGETQTCIIDQQLREEVLRLSG